MILNDLILLVPPTAATDRYNNQKLTYDEADGLLVPCQVQPLNTTEVIGARERDQVLADFRVWVPAGTAVTAQYRAKWQEMWLAVAGAPGRWRSASGVIDHVTFDCNVSTG